MIQNIGIGEVIRHKRKGGDKMRHLAMIVLSICFFGMSYGTSFAMDPACKAAATAEKKACKAACIDDFHTSLFQCQGINPVCGNPCLAAKINCKQTVEASRDSCIADCDAQLQANKATCMPPPPCNGDPACDSCVDAFQVQAFVCRDNCREAFNQDPTKQAELALCKSTFRACIRACD